MKFLKEEVWRPKNLKSIESFEEKFNEVDFNSLGILPKDLIFKHPLLRPITLKKEKNIF